MARIAVCVYTLAACALLLTGCQTGRRQAANPFTRGTRIARGDEEGTPSANGRFVERVAVSRFDETPIAGGESSESPSGDLALADHELAHLPEDEQRRIRENLATMDPASARIVVRTIRATNDLARRTRSADETSPDRSGAARLASGLADHTGSGLGGGHSFGSRPSNDGFADPRGEARVVEGLGEASAWNDDRTSGAGNGLHTTYRPDAQRWPGPQSETAPASPLDRLTGQLTGVLPTAASNAAPSVVMTGDARVREPAEPRGPRIGTLAFGTPPGATDANRSNATPSNATPNDVPADRTMSRSFDTSPPPRRALVGGSAATSDGTTPLEQLVDQLERDTRDARPGDDPAARLAYVERHVFLRLMYIAAGDDRAFVAIPGLAPAEQTFWTNYLFATANYLDAEGIPDPKDRAGQTVSQLRSAILALQADARLELRNVGFCSVISSFGNYEPIESTQLRPGAEVLVYAEVENFHSETTADGHYRTLLRSEIEFYGPNGSLVSTPIDFKTSEDRTRNHRRDYFLSFSFQLPSDLPPGPQSMKVIVTDELTGRTDTHSMNFTIAP